MIPALSPLRRFAFPARAIATLMLVAALYWPVRHAGFVWVDKASLVDIGWLRGDDWLRYIFHNFYDWTNYFRPLVVALFVLEERAFAVAPEPMHLVSLGLHLANVALVGLIANRLADGAEPGRRRALVPLAMLLYGLHPALIEPVVWISCQFDLVATLFMLAAMACNLTLQHTAPRAIAVAACFFLAACAKESAAVFPALLFLVDALRVQAVLPAASRLAQLRELFRRQWPVYAAVVAAGVSYLALRWYSMGFLLQAQGPGAASPLVRLQTGAYLLLTYWRIVLWPMIGLSPLHEIDSRPFATAGAAELATDAGALLLLALGAALIWKRKPIGFLFAAATIALLPALHLVPIDFDSSLYHERYAIVAIAFACALLPTVLAGWRLPRKRIVAVAAVAVAVVWLAFAAANIAVTLPLWSDEAQLWTWVLKEHPQSVLAKNHLLSTWLGRGDMAHARPLAADLFTSGRRCPICLVNVANVALNDGEAGAARRALDRAAPMLQRANQPRISAADAVATGRLHELEHDVGGAEAAYRDAIAIEPDDPQAHLLLALLLAREGRRSEAQAQAAAALRLFAPGERAARRQLFEDTLAASRQALSRPAER